MATSWFACKPCSAADPTQDTVKVDPALLNKENVQPLHLDNQSAKEQRQPEAEKETAARRQKEEAAAAAAEAARLGEERAAAERTRREEAVRAARRQAEEAARREASERLQLQKLEVEKARKEQADAAARDAAAAAAAAVEAEWQQQQAERAARKEALEKVNAWCKKNSFQGINASKKTYRGSTKFPLHTAVKHNDQEIVSMMLLVGAQKNVRDSKNQTPSELASKMNTNGSHEQILGMLR